MANSTDAIDHGNVGELLSAAENLGNMLVGVESAMAQFKIAWSNNHLKADNFKVYEQPLYRYLSDNRDRYRKRLVSINDEMLMRKL